MSMSSATTAKDRTSPRPQRSADIRTSYRVRCSAADVEDLADRVALEQTVEVPRALVQSERILEQVVGRVAGITPVTGEANAFDVLVEYPCDLSAFNLTQTINLLYGNISLNRQILLRDVEFPAEFLEQFRGPRFGIAGLRTLLQVPSRPLLATALKPRGSTVTEFARMAGDFARGGGDLVKDDHNLTDTTFDGFRERVEACHAAVEQANAITGLHTMYLPNISGTQSMMARQLEFVSQLGVRGVLVAPLLAGLETVREWSQRLPLVLMGHPTFTGALFQDPGHGIDPAFFLGRIFRLAGCDSVIFPNAGGRFSFSTEDCSQIAMACRAPWGSIRSAWPTPAGGMSFDTLDAMSTQFGPDTVFLIGGALLADSPDLAASTQRFRERIEALAPGLKAAGQVDESFSSACEWTSPGVHHPTSAGGSSLDHGPGANGAPKSAGRSQTETSPPNGSTSANRRTAGHHGNGSAANGHADLDSLLPAAVCEYLPAVAPGQWQDRAATEYKADSRLPFAGISRTELLGQTGERMAFDLRYFEIAAGGSSSREQHGHTHVIIGVRGRGQLQSGSEIYSIGPQDIAYVPPWQVHQLTNSAAEPFGFYCLVDHTRDRPQAPE